MKRFPHIFLSLCVALAMSVSCLPAAAPQDADKPAADDLAFWDNRDRSRPAAAATVVGLGDHPLAAFVLRATGLRFVVWDEVGFADAFAPELNPTLLRDMKDGRWLPNITARPNREVPTEDWAFYRAYSEALVRSFDTPFDAFKKSGAENKHVTVAHLMSTPHNFRGKVIPIKGTLTNLPRVDPSLLAKQIGGLKDVYVGWVFGPTAHSTPFCVQFPILPEGLEPAEKMRQEVTFYGYFLATFRYEGARQDDQPTVWVTPLLVGPTIVVEKKTAAPAAVETPLPLIALGAAIGFGLFLSVVFFVMNFWLRRNDRTVLSKLDAIKAKYSPAPFVDEAEPMGTIANPAPSQLVFDKTTTTLPEAKPIDPERN